MLRTNRRVGTFAVTAFAAVLLTACGSGTSKSSSAGPPATPPAAGAPSDNPPAASDPGSVGGGAPGDPGSGTGIGLPIGPTPIDPGAGQPTIVMPKPGRLNRHPVAPIRLEAAVDGRHLLVKVSWYGGVAPCSVLDSVGIAERGTTISLTVFEGADAADAICPEIAMLKATIVDLGDLEPGIWRIAATDGELPPIQVTIG